MSMSEVILRGSTNAPAQGAAGAFYGKQFVFSHVEWLYKRAQVMTDGDNHTPPLMTKIINKGNFVYLYKMNEKGRWESAYYTTQKIAHGPEISDFRLNQEEAAIAHKGMEKAPSVPGGVTGTFYIHQFVKTADEFKRLGKIADAYIGDDNIAVWNENGFCYRYYYDRENDIWYSMYFTASNILGYE